MKDQLKGSIELNFEMVWGAILELSATFGIIGGLIWGHVLVAGVAALVLIVCIARWIRLNRFIKIADAKRWAEHDQYEAMVEKYGADLAARRFKNGARD